MKTCVKFDRTDTKAVKGIAILLMLLHHLAAFPDRFPTGFGGFTAFLWKGFAENGYLKDFASAAKICVSLFFFLGGYGLYKRLQGGKLSIKETLVGLYRSYWKVFVIFIPLALFVFARPEGGINPLASLYDFKSVKDAVVAVVSDLSGWTCKFNREWWFFISYVCAVPMGYLFCCACKKIRNFWVELFLVFSLDIFIRSVFPAIAATETFSALGSNVFYTRFFTITDYAGTFLPASCLPSTTASARSKRCCCGCRWHRWAALQDL